MSIIWDPGNTNRMYGFVNQKIEQYLIQASLAEAKGLPSAEIAQTQKLHSAS